MIWLARGAVGVVLLLMAAEVVAGVRKGGDRKAGIVRGGYEG